MGGLVDAATVAISEDSAERDVSTILLMIFVILMFIKLNHYTFIVIYNFLL